MRVLLERLVLRLRVGTESVAFSEVTVFHGKIGVGKSTTANLLDFCFGGTLHHETPALQEEWREASLELRLADVPVAIARGRGSNSVRVSWGSGDEVQFLELPARIPNGIRLEGTQVEVLSDLLFHLSGTTPPRVRRSKIKSDSDLVRLSFRDVWAFCYLDQRSMDNSLFHLEPNAPWERRLKALDVVRFVLGVEHEKIGLLEGQLDDLRVEKRALNEGAGLLRTTLDEAGVGSADEADARIAAARERLSSAEAALAALRGDERSKATHAADEIRRRLRAASDNLATHQHSIAEASERLSDEKRQRSELAVVGTRFGRTLQARTVLGTTTFASCPRCVQALPPRAAEVCRVCGQVEPAPSDSDIDVASSDLRERIVEVERAITARERVLRGLRRDSQAAAGAKADLEEEFAEVLGAYDPALVSQLVLRERDFAVAREELKREALLRQLPARVDEMLAAAAALAPRENELRDQIRRAREAAAERNDRLEELGTLLLDTLVRAKMPGITLNDRVAFDSSSFYPEVLSGGDDTRPRRDFLSLSSGGKTTVFKCCFALAMHRLNVSVGGPLPSIIVMDTPMKNISERTNREIFEAFYTLLYELAGSELKGVQFIIIDKELSVPPEGFARPFVERLMTLDDPDHPPLIRGYKE